MHIVFFYKNELIRRILLLPRTGDSEMRANTNITDPGTSGPGLGRGGPPVVAIAEPLPSRTRVCTGEHCKGAPTIHFAVLAGAATGAPVPEAKLVR